MDTYAWGNQLYDNGSYDQSAEVFISMGDFSDAATRANEASYAAAEASMNAGDYDVAAKRFAALKDYKDSAEMVKECDYRYAIKLFNDGNYVSAKAAFFALNGYSDSISMAKKCNYQLAQEAMAREDYENAAFLFDSAGTYSDSEAQATECRRLAAIQKGEEYEVHNAYESAYAQYALANETDKMAEMAYQTAMSKMTASDYAGAIQWFEKAGYGYNDVNEQILSIGEYYYATQQYDAAEAVYVKVANTGVAAQRLYELGQYYELAGDVEHAAKAYGEAENYEDASAKAKAMQMEADYRTAESLYGTGSYQKAKAIYAELAGYKDADSKLAACVVATKFTVGTYVEFGTYPQTKAGTDSTPIEWLVLACDDSKALLISRYGLDAQPYNLKCVATTWEKCTLRSWLNTAFLTKAFTAEEQQAILTTTVDNSSSQGFNSLSTIGGNNTQDKVFLLSYAEAHEYFGVTFVNGKNIKARVEPTAYAAEQGKLDLKYSFKTAGGERSCKWWLRSPGNTSARASYVDRDGSLYYTEVTRTCCCVRPALWVNLESGIF